MMSLTCVVFIKINKCDEAVEGGDGGRDGGVEGPDKVSRG